MSRRGGVLVGESPRLEKNSDSAQAPSLVLWEPWRAASGLGNGALAGPRAAFSAASAQFCDEWWATASS